VGDRPFDARETWLREPAGPPEWRTVSLVTAARALAEFDGPHLGQGRERLLLACLEELTRRGLDGESLLRFGLGPELLAPLFFRQVVAPVMGPEHTARADELMAQRGIDLDGWADLLGQPSTPVNAASLAEAIGPAVLWVLAAPVGRLMTLKAPTPDELSEAIDRDAPDSALLEQYRWLVDRFSTTRIQDWELTSLHLEYRFTVGELPHPCSDDLMADREVSLDELNAEIARRAVHPRPAPSAPYGSVLAHQMQRQAVDLLQNGRRREAAALFEFAVTQDSSDSLARNNLGFCLLPDDPESALKHFQVAQTLGYVPIVVNVYNQVLALRILRRAREALLFAERHWSSVSAGRVHGGVLWRQVGDGSLKLTDFEDCRAALVDLCIDLAGDQSQLQHQTWLARAG
jgi:hypothetical protein